MQDLPKNLNRLEKVVEIIKNEGKVSVSYLSKFLNVTEMTIYSDLKKIKDRNIILTKKEIIYVGANSFLDDPHFDRLNQYAEGKKSIAKKAIKYLSNSDTVFFDGSTTTHYLAKLLVSKKKLLHLTIITYSPVIALELAKNPGINIICLGGKLERVNYIFLDTSLTFFNNININKSFISCVGISKQNGFTEMIEGEATLKKKLLEISGENNILADATKFSKTGTYTFGSLSTATRIIVDKPSSVRNNREFREIKEKIQ